MSYSELDFDDGQVACAIGVAAVIARVDEQRAAESVCAELAPVEAEAAHHAHRRSPATAGVSG